MKGRPNGPRQNNKARHCATALGNLNCVAKARLRPRSGAFHTTSTSSSLHTLLPHIHLPHDTTLYVLAITIRQATADAAGGKAPWPADNSATSG